MKKLLGSLIALGLLVLGLLIFDVVDDYQNQKKRTEIHNAKLEEVSSAGAFVISDNAFATLNEEYIGINIHGENLSAELHISGEIIEVQIGEIFEVDGKQFEVYDIFENISPGRWEIAIREL